MNYQSDMQNMASMQRNISGMNNSCAIQGNMLGPYMAGMMDASPRAVKKRNAHAYAADVRARTPSMQVKRMKEPA